MATLSEAGWHLTEDGLKACNKSAKEALDLDLRDIGAECLPEEINRGKAAVLDGGFVLQVSFWFSCFLGFFLGFHKIYLAEKKNRTFIQIQQT